MQHKEYLRERPVVVSVKDGNPELHRSVIKSEADQSLCVGIAGNGRAAPAHRANAAGKRFFDELLAVTDVREAPVVNGQHLRGFFFRRGEILLRGDSHDAGMAFEGTPCNCGIIQFQFLNHRHDS